jgi:hypothetical protein
VLSTSYLENSHIFQTCIYILMTYVKQWMYKIYNFKTSIKVFLVKIICCSDKQFQCSSPTRNDRHRVFYNLWKRVDKPKVFFGDSDRVLSDPYRANVLEISSIFDSIKPVIEFGRVWRHEKQQSRQDPILRLRFTTPTGSLACFENKKIFHSTLKNALAYYIQCWRCSCKFKSRT